MPVRSLLLIAGDGLFQSLPDESLIRNPSCPGTALNRVQQRLRHPHVDPSALRLEFEPEALYAGKVILCKIGGVDESLRLLSRAFQSLELLMSPDLRSIDGP